MSSPKITYTNEVNEVPKHYKSIFVHLRKMQSKLEIYCEMP
jgi:hypothetical protein